MAGRCRQHAVCSAVKIYITAVSRMQYNPKLTQQIQNKLIIVCNWQQPRRKLDRGINQTVRQLCKISKMSPSDWRSDDSRSVRNNPYAICSVRPLIMTYRTAITAIVKNNNKEEKTTQSQLTHHTSGTNGVGSNPPAVAVCPCGLITLTSCWVTSRASEVIL